MTQTLCTNVHVLQSQNGTNKKRAEKNLYWQTGEKSLRNKTAFFIVFIFISQRKTL